MSVNEDPVKGATAELLRKLKRLMFLRVLFATFLLAVTAVVQAKAYQFFINASPISLYTVAVLIYFATGCYVLLLRRLHRANRVKLLAYIQLVLDVVFVTALIYVTGGIESIFSFMYILVIINAAIMLYRRGGLFIASASSIFYGVLLDMQYFGLAHPFYTRSSTAMHYSSGYYFYTVLMNIMAFYAVAFLSSYLAEELRRSGAKLEEKQYDLDQLELLNRNIVQSINSGLITLDNALRITYVNRAAESISGFKLAEMQGKHISAIFPEIAPRLIGGKQSRGDGARRRPERNDFSFTRKDGTTVHLGFSQSVLSDPRGHEFGLILIFQDLTEIRRMEEQIRRMDRLAVVGELAAGIAHEIKNPLASLSGSLQMMRDELTLEDEYQRLMDITLREAERLNALVNEFLLFSKPARKAEESVEIHQVINDTLEILGNSPELPRLVRIRKNFADNLWVNIDSQQLEQVIWNLMLNALHSMNDGGEICISTGIHYENGTGNSRKNFAKISILDTGPGIPQEIQDKIFNPFFTTKESGTGLGLTIVHRIIENYGGRIFFKSDGRSGTTFTIYLPLASTDHSPENGSLESE
ncbi:MAG: PAS domain S-box protein [Deltaproteobacteria bacterium]|nr:PAS domain S-box protein [Deltaproteobacteria bacterium]MBW2069977.1 PAS domain S-box protein [Deltaproteobacteria bacterium]